MRRRILTRPCLFALMCLIWIIAMVCLLGKPKNDNSNVSPERNASSNEDHQDTSTQLVQIHELLQKSNSEAGQLIFTQKLKRRKTEITAKKATTSASKTRSVDIVIGIPSIKRPGGKVYLSETLESVVRKRHKFDSAIFVVYLAELDEEWREIMADFVKTKFADEVDQGLIQIIYPPADLYPDWSKKMKISKLSRTLNDPPHRVQWRSKQNLDQIYLMKYAYSLRPKYFLSIEDDVLATDNYLATIFQHAESIQRDDILFISYCQWGVMGKLFPSKRLPAVLRYLMYFWNDMPLDWLYFNMKKAWTCDSPRNCKEDDLIVVEYETDLFQHIGRISSLKRSES